MLQNASKDLLLLLTEHYKFALLEYNPSGPAGTPELVTRATCDVKDAIGRPVEAGQLAAVDPDCRAIALHLYDGQLKVCAAAPATGLVYAHCTVGIFFAWEQQVR